MWECVNFSANWLLWILCEIDTHTYIFTRNACHSLTSIRWDLPRNTRTVQVSKCVPLSQCTKFKIITEILLFIQYKIQSSYTIYAHRLWDFEYDCCFFRADCSSFAAYCFIASLTAAVKSFIRTYMRMWFIEIYAILTTWQGIL